MLQCAAKATSMSLAAAVFFHQSQFRKHSCRLTIQIGAELLEAPA
jgi:hypothetical protein